MNRIILSVLFKRVCILVPLIFAWAIALFFGLLVFIGVLRYFVCCLAKESDEFEWPYWESLLIMAAITIVATLVVNVLMYIEDKYILKEQGAKLFR